MSWTKRWRKKKDNHYGERKKDGRDREVFSKKRSMKRERVSEWVRPTAVTGPRGKKYCCLIPNWLSLNWSHGFQENKNERERERERDEPPKNLLMFAFGKNFILILPDDVDFFFFLYVREEFISTNSRMNDFRPRMKIWLNLELQSSL